MAAAAAAVAAAEPTGTAIEALFRRKVAENRTELELLPGFSVENILASCIYISWGGFCRFLRDKVVWMTPDVYIRSRYLSVSDNPLVLVIGDDDLDWENSLRVHVTPGMAAAATVTCDFLLRLLATSAQHNLYARGQNSWVASPLSGAGLSLFFQECPSCLCRVTLDYMALSEDHCRALATMSRFDVEVKISECRLMNDAAGAFIECLQSDRGPIQLIRCKIDSQILASALAGKSRVTKLIEPTGVNWTTTNAAGMAVLFTALASNRGMLDLNLRGQPINDENWTILCESLKAHPTLTSLNLCNTTGVGIGLTDERKTNLTCLLAKMVQQNTVLHTVHLSEHERDAQIFTEEIHPYLEANLYRPRVLAVKKTNERPFREKVLGRALYCVRSNPNLAWMFLSENVDAFVRSEEESNNEVVVAVAVAPVAEEVGSSSV
jgi:hypothetical protein